MSEILWKPTKEIISTSNIYKFMEFLKTKKLNFTNYHDLYQWSIKYKEDFWKYLLEFSEIKLSTQYYNVLDNGYDMINSKWFVGARLNFAENLLKFRDNTIALEYTNEDCEFGKISYGELYDEVSKLVKSFEDFGIKENDKIVGYLPNIPETVIAMLATTSLGAVWSSCSTDLGYKSLIDRFFQIKPRILFMTESYKLNGRENNLHEEIPKILKGIPTLEKIIIITQDSINYENCERYSDFLSEKEEITFRQLPFDHPVYILYTSGTTGKPKCIVHGAGGTLIQHYKEHALHNNLKRGDKLHYTTTCGWVLWNWMMGSLMIGSTLVLRDGSPFYPRSDILFKLIEELNITHFGVSAKYIASIEKLELKPREKFNLDSLKVLMYGGSALSENGYRYVYKNIKENLMISSMAGGTDIVSCFALGNPLQEVRAGEIQGWGLGMDCDVFDRNGKSLQGKKGELVCKSSFPCQPIYFLNDENKEKYKNAYFNVYDNIWRHGDYSEVKRGGGIVIYGRSDSTLNPGGVRIGTSEIYQQVDGIDEIEDSIVIGQRWKDDVRIVLFVKLKEGIELNRELERKIKRSIIDNCSVNHVPAKIIPIKDIPYTINGKKVEIAVRKVIENEEILNKESLRNPEALEYYRDLEELKND